MIGKRKEEEKSKKTTARWAVNLIKEIICDIFSLYFRLRTKTRNRMQLRNDKNEFRAEGIRDGRVNFWLFFFQMEIEIDIKSCNKKREASHSTSLSTEIEKIDELVNIERFIANGACMCCQFIAAHGNVWVDKSDILEHTAPID